MSYTGKAPSITRVRSAVAKANGVKVSEVTATWTERPRKVTYPTGLVGHRAEAVVTLPGFDGPQRAIVTENRYGFYVDPCRTFSILAPLARR